MSQLYISRSHVRKSLARVAIVRLCLTLAAPIAAVALLAAAYPEAFHNIPVLAAAIVVPPIVVWLLVTNFYCRREVKCPACGGELWDVAKGSLLAGGMKDGATATSCPHCGAVLI